MFWSKENKSCIRVDESWQVRVCMRVFLTFLFLLNENKSWWEFQLLCSGSSESLYESMRVFSTVMSWLNNNKSCMRVDESWQTRVGMRVFSTLMCWSNENKSYMRVDKRVVWEFFQLSCRSCLLQTLVFVLVNFIIYRQPYNYFLISFPDVFSKISMTSPSLVRKIPICRNSIRHLENLDAKTFLITCRCWIETSPNCRKS